MTQAPDVLTGASTPALRTLARRRVDLASPTFQRTLLNQVPLDHLGAQAGDFDATLAATGGDLSPAQLEILQINVGKLCNMTCRHCHVDAGPDRTDAMMSRATVEACVAALARMPAHTVDLTGGAPELHPDFRWLVEQARGMGRHVIDRCNLTILLLPRFEGLTEFLATQQVEVVASLPHYRARNTDAQRGDGTFEKSIEALRLLNRHGYGQGDPGRRLTLMSNPAGAFLGGNQAAMELEWKGRLLEDFGIRFDRLFVLNNMPISRYLEWLAESGNLQKYMEKLVQAYNPGAVPGVMCRNTVSVGWDGRVYDCDFNQMLDMQSEDRSGAGLDITSLTLESWQQHRIRTDRHCFGCTAGAGSSCGGNTAA
jgi:radical SAM/Cys-rich protein